MIGIQSVLLNGRLISKLGLIHRSNDPNQLDEWYKKSQVTQRHSLPGSNDGSRSKRPEPDPVDASDMFDRRHLQLGRLLWFGRLFLLFIAAAFVVVVFGLFGATTFDRVQIKHLEISKLLYLSWDHLKGQFKWSLSGAVSLYGWLPVWPIQKCTFVQHRDIFLNWSNRRSIIQRYFLFKWSLIKVLNLNMHKMCHE